MIQKAADVPGQAVRTVTPTTRTEPVVDLVDVQQDLMRFADEFTSRLVVGIDKLYQGIGPVEQAARLRWKIAFGTATCTIASGPNTVANLLDMTVFVTEARMSLEEHWQPKVFGEAAQPMIDSCRLAEAEPGCTLAELADRVTAATMAAHPRVVGDWSRPVRRVAIVGGSGASFIGAARRAGADVLVTGDVKHHDALLAARLGLALVDPGHFASERLVIGQTAAYVSACFPELKVTETSVDGEPFARRPGG